MKVTSVSFDGGHNKEVYLPDTINKISDNFITPWNYNNYINCVISAVVAFVLTTIVILIVKDRTPEEIAVSTPIYVWTLVFLGITFYANYNSNHSYSFGSSIQTYAIFSNLMYLIVVVTIMFTNKRNKKLDTNIKNKTKFIDEMIFKINNISKLNSEYKNKLIDKLKYSDPVSNEIVKDIEDNINMLISKLNDKSSNEEIDNIIKLIENRNDIIKRNK